MASISSAPSAPSAPVTFEPDGVWIKDPMNSALNLRVLTETKWQQVNRTKQRSTKRPLGRKQPVVLSGDSNGESFSLTFLELGDDDFDALMALADREAVLLVQTPRRQWYVEVSADIGVSEHLWDRDQDPARKVTIPFQEVSEIDV